MTSYKKGAAIGIAAIMLFILFARYLPTSLIRLDLQLTFTYKGSYDDHISIGYHWSGGSAENNSGELTFEWEKKTSTGSYGVKNAVDEAIIGYFSVLTAENNRLSINSAGEWLVQTTLQIIEGFSISLGVEGTSEGIHGCSIEAELDMLPEELKNELISLGIEELSLSAKVTISINPDFFEIIVHVISSFINQLIETFEQIVDTIQFLIEQ